MSTAALELPTIEPQHASAAAVKFHLSLNVSDFDRSIVFLRALLSREPAKCRPDYAKFELDEPPLVLSLEPHAPTSFGALNHLGFRLRDSAELVEWQRRLEMAGISTQREEGVECCYSRQTKFWVRDPDNNLWEIYVLEEGSTCSKRISSTVALVRPPISCRNRTPHRWLLGRSLPRRSGSISSLPGPASYVTPVPECWQTRPLPGLATLP
jgi:catechol 2,3-dioxygenase-like lactoylglutathione lyase family enzyme